MILVDFNNFADEWKCQHPPTTHELSVDELWFLLRSIFGVHRSNRNWFLTYIDRRFQSQVLGIFCGSRIHQKPMIWILSAGVGSCPCSIDPGVRSHGHHQLYSWLDQRAIRARIRMCFNAHGRNRRGLKMSCTPGSRILGINHLLHGTRFVWYSNI